MEKTQRQKSFAIIGASGRLGRSAAKFLLERGCEVRVIGRNPHNLYDLIQAGALPYIGDLQDTGFLQTAFAGVDGVLAMIPGWDLQPEVRQYVNDLGVSIFTACLVCNTPRVVNISDYGIRFKSAGDYLLGMQDQEFRLNILPKSHVVHLRPAFFLPNFHRALDESLGAATDPANAPPLDAPLAEEIGEVAAAFLYEEKFSGKNIVELLGGDVTLIKSALAASSSQARH